MHLPIFLSCPTPFLKRQDAFLKAVQEGLRKRGMTPRTLGDTDYDLEVPLRAVRRMMLESNGVLTIAFRRYRIDAGVSKPASDFEVPSPPMSLKDRWFTSPWSQIESAMAFQLGLPVLVVRESGVLDDGLLERGILDIYMPEFDLDHPIDDYLESRQWTELVSAWERNVRTVSLSKGTPPKLY